MKIETYIDSLVSYAMNNGLAEPADHVVLTNRLLDILRKDDYEPSNETQTEDLEEILAGLLVKCMQTTQFCSRLSAITIRVLLCLKAHRAIALSALSTQVGWIPAPVRSAAAARPVLCRTMS